MEDKKSAHVLAEEKSPKRFMIALYNSYYCGRYPCHSLLARCFLKSWYLHDILNYLGKEISLKVKEILRMFSDL